MRWKLFMRNMSVSAPRVRVRSSLPWRLRVLLSCLALAIGVAAGISIYRYGRDIAVPRELAAQVEQLTSQLHDVSAERDRLVARSNSFEGDLKVVRAAQDQLGQQVRALEDENTRLKEDLAFYDSLLPVARGDKGVVIRSFRMQADDPQRMHFRLLIQQNGKADRDFVGSVRLEVKCLENGAQNGQSGATTVVEVPEADATPDRAKVFALSFRHYQRLEGTFSLPPGTVARSVIVRVLAAGETQTQQSFTL